MVGTVHDYKEYWSYCTYTGTYTPGTLHKLPHILSPHLPRRSTTMAPSSQTPLLTEFLTTVNHARVNKDPQFLCNCLLLTPHSIVQNHLMLSLRNELLPLTPAYIENQCYDILGEEWISFTDMVIGYCGTYLREVDVEGVAMGSGGVPATEGWCSELSTLMG